MSKKVKLTITILDAETKLTFLLIGFLCRLGYDPLPKKTRGRPGSLKFVFKRGEKE